MRALPVLLTIALAAGAAAAQGEFEQMTDLLERGFYNSAARVVGPALVQSNSEDPQAHYLYARALYLTGDIGGARRALDAGLELAGGDVPAAFTNLDGLITAAQGNLREGVDLLQRAFEKSGDYEHAMDWGRIAWQAYLLEDALAAYEAAAATEAGARSPWPHLNRARLLTFLGRTDAAIEAYRTAIAVFEEHDTGEARPSPAYVEAYFRLGQIYESQGQAQNDPRLLQLALDHYRAALTGDPNYAPAIEALDSLSRGLP